MKKKSVLALVSLMVVSAMFMTGAAADQGEDVRSFTLQQAVDYALENSSAIKLADTAVDKANVSLREAKSAYSKMEDANSGVSLEVFKVEKGYYKKAAEMGLTLAEKGREQAAEGVKMGVQSAYFDLLFAREKVEIQKSVLDSARRDMDVANRKYELGMVSQMDVLSYEASLETAKLNYAAALRDEEYKRMSFNRTLGLPLKTEVALTDALSHQQPPEVDIEEKVALALENRYEIIAAKGQSDLDKMNFELTASWYPDNTYVHQQAKYQAESSAYKLVSAQQDVELSVRKAYMDMMSAYDSIAVLGKNVETLQKAYDIAKLRYDVGMATNQDVINALNSLNDVKLQQLKAIHGYNLARIQFEASYGVGIGSAGGF
ncbi:MAG: TolC family protein [Bacillota bacterium]|nr:TolC family protein [Bacillota bacterium]